MKFEKQGILFTEEDIKEIFSLFTSPTDYERKQIYDRSSHLFFKKTDIEEEYSLTQEKREFAWDAIRAVFYFLHSKGFKLSKYGEILDLGGIENEFITCIPLKDFVPTDACKLIKEGQGN